MHTYYYSVKFSTHVKLFVHENYIHENKENFLAEIIPIKISIYMVYMCAMPSCTCLSSFFIYIFQNSINKDACNHV